MLIIHWICPYYLFSLVKKMFKKHDWRLSEGRSYSVEVGLLRMQMHRACNWRPAVHSERISSSQRFMLCTFRNNAWTQNTITVCSLRICNCCEKIEFYKACLLFLHLSWSPPCMWIVQLRWKTGRVLAICHFPFPATNSFTVSILCLMLLSY